MGMGGGRGAICPSPLDFVKIKTEEKNKYTK
jgi:hypothetical protein